MVSRGSGESSHVRKSFIGHTQSDLEIMNDIMPPWMNSCDKF